MIKTYFVYVKVELIEMPTQKRKHDDFVELQTNLHREKISFSTRSSLLELCAAPSEQVNKLSATLLDTEM